MSKRLEWGLLGLYLVLFGIYCGLELDTFVADLPFFQVSTLILFVNILCVVLAPVALYLLFASLPGIWRRRGGPHRRLYAHSGRLSFPPLPCGLQIGP